MRIGIATGLVVIGDFVSKAASEADAVIGETPNLAARLQSAAKPGTVVIDSATQQLIGRGFELAYFGSHKMKGFAEPIAAWRVIGERSTEDRFEALHGAQLTPFIGRAEELALLKERWERAKTGEGQLVLLSGEPGIGKSRAARMLMEGITIEPHSTLRYQCSPYHSSTALHPVIKHLEKGAEINAHDPAPVRLAKLESLLSDSSDSSLADLAFFADLLSIDTPVCTGIEPDPQRRRRLTFEALIGRVLKLAQKQPLLMLFEDLHWADPTTLDLLSELATRTQNVPILMVMTFRPDFQVPWGGQPHVTTLAVTRLTRQQTEEMVHSLAQGKQLPETVMEQILDKTEGIPLFIEELTKEVLDSGVLAAGEKDYTLVGELPSVAIPSSLQDSLMARLDRLAPVREVAQIGAVIGREFPHDLLAQVAPVGDNQLSEALSQLISAELIYRRGSPPDAIYVFKHALVQDAAYESLLNAKRVQLHQTIAQLLESNFPEISRTQPELLAEHFTKANLVEQAIKYWHKAGQHSSAQGAHAEAIQQLTRCLELLQTLPDDSNRKRREIDIRVALGVPLMSGLGAAAPEVEQNYTRARELCDLMGETQFLFPVLWGLWMGSMMRSDMHRMCQLSDELLVLGQQQRDTALEIEAHHCQWTSHFLIGEPAVTLEHTERGLALYRSDEHHQLTFTYGGHDPGACCRNIGALALLIRGNLDQARKQMDAGLTLSRELQHSATLADTLGVLVDFSMALREYSTLEKPLDELTELATSEKYQNYVAMSETSRGCCLFERGSREEGVAMIRRALPQLFGGDFAWFAPLVSEVVSIFGRAVSTEEALDLINRAIKLAQSSGVHWWDAEFHRVHGELLVTRDPGGAENAFDQALRIARTQNARFLELRAAKDQAALWHRQGRTVEAKELLAPVYNWFTEGLGATDLRGAKVLLSKLNG